MDFLANENFPLLSVKILRSSGHNVVSVIEETPGAKDSDIIKRAQQEKCIVLTFDRDYGELIYRRRSTTGVPVVYFRFNPSSPDEPATILLNILAEKAITITGKFTVIERGRVRQRKL